IIKAPMPPAAGEEWAYGASLGFTDVGPDGLFAPGQIYRCEPAGTWMVGLFDPLASGAADTPGLPNVSCPAPPCPADIAPDGGDGVVNVQDLLKVINSWGNCPVPPNPCVADIAPPGGDGVVNVQDLLKVINSWGNCPAN